LGARPVLPSADTAAMLFWALLASGQINMRKVDGWALIALQLWSHWERMRSSFIRSARWGQLIQPWATISIPSISKKLQNDKQFDPLADIFNAAAPPQLPPQNQACLVPPGTMFEDTYKYVIVESARLSSAFDVKRRFVVAAAGPQFEPLIRAETLDQQWSHQPAPAPVPEAPQT
jgi:hypothetical protein